jgi:hypothetical protein
MSIPKVREKILQLANELQAIDHLDYAERLREIEQELYRRKRSVRAPNSSKPCTEEMRRAIRAYKRAHPRVTQQKIADRFGVNSGRVNEALIGFAD